MEEVFNTNIQNVDEFNVFNLKGIEIANRNDDKLLKSFLKNVEAFVNDGQFELDLQKASKALMFKKEDYQERTDFLEAFSEVISDSIFVKCFLGPRDQALLAILLLCFKEQGKIINFKRLSNLAAFQNRL